MANKIVDEEARKQIGTVGEARTYDVERGAIRRFAEAIGDPNPLFNDEKEARHVFGGMVAPPTFCRSMGSPIPNVQLKGTRRRIPRPRRRLGLGIFPADSPRRSHHRAIEAGRPARV